MLTFQTVGRDVVEATAGEYGDYLAFALQPVTRVAVALEGLDREPWRDLYIPPIRYSRELSFDIPDADVTVRVLDATTGQGIPGARLGVRNDYRSSSERRAEGGENDAPRPTMSGESYRADDDGVVRLPPPRSGRLEIHAHAEGYRGTEEPLILAVPDPPEDHEMEILLEPIGGELELRLLLPDGSAAVGAEVLHLDSLANGVTHSSARADARGMVRLPGQPVDGLLLMKHPGAAFGIVERARWRTEERVEWSFPRASANRLSVRVWDPSGEETAPSAAISLWVGDRKLSGPMLYWLLGTRPVADANGFWTAGHLPPVTLRVLAWASGLDAEAQAGGLDAFATEIEFPWPAQVDVRVVR